uniref:Uncharacterized protein n=1 Tax=Chelonoidis abingdonii TaxID=106734 RepID=A0A8C0GPL6_CHEAB
RKVPLSPLPLPKGSSELHLLNIPLLLCFCSQINTRIANEKYLRSHKEVELLLSGFLREVMLRRPENIPEFAAGKTIILILLDMKSKTC